MAASGCPECSNVRQPTCADLVTGNVAILDYRERYLQQCERGDLALRGDADRTGDVLPRQGSLKNHGARAASERRVSGWLAGAPQGAPAFTTNGNDLVTKIELSTIDAALMRSQEREKCKE